MLLQNRFFFFGVKLKTKPSWWRDNGAELAFEAARAAFIQINTEMTPTNKHEDSPAATWLKVDVADPLRNKKVRLFRSAGVRPDAAATSFGTRR